MGCSLTLTFTGDCTKFWSVVVQSLESTKESEIARINRKTILFPYKMDLYIIKTVTIHKNKTF